jgi:Mn-containing catalase
MKPTAEQAFTQNLNNLQYTFSADNQSQADKLFRGASPSNDGAELKTTLMPDGVPIEIAPERREEFSPGLDAELLEMMQVTAEQELRKVDEPGKG